MFTGIIQAIGRIAAIEPARRHSTAHRDGQVAAGGISLGDSIATRAFASP